MEEYLTNSLYLIPGTMCDHRLWEPLSLLLKEYSVSQVDYRDCSNLKSMIDRVAASIPVGACAVGFSLGGYLVAELAIRRPDLFDSIILIATSLTGLSSEEKKLRSDNVELLRSPLWKGMSKQRVAQFVHEKNIANPKIVKTIITMEKDLDQRTLINQLLATLERRNLHEHIEKLGLRTLLIGSEHDKIASLNNMKKLANISEFIDLKITRSLHEPSGHMIPLEAPVELASMIKDWLKKHNKKAR